MEAHERTAEDAERRPLVKRVSQPLYSAVDLTKLPLSNKSRARLIKRLRRALELSKLALHVLYAVAVVFLVAGFWLFSFIEWLSSRLGLAVGEGLCIGCAVAFLTKRYLHGVRLLNAARGVLSNERLDDDVFDIVADALKKFAKRVFEATGLVLSAWIAPLAVKAPEAVGRVLPASMDTVDSRHAMRGVVGALGAIGAFAAVYAYEAARDATMQLIDDAVDHIDDMPEFDFLSDVEDDVSITGGDMSDEEFLDAHSGGAHRSV